MGKMSYICLDDNELKNVTDRLKRLNKGFKVHRNKEKMLLIEGKNIKYFVVEE